MTKLVEERLIGLAGYTYQKEWPLQWADRSRAQGLLINTFFVKYA